MIRFEQAAMMTVEEQRRAQSYSDRIIAWVIELVRGESVLLACLMCLLAK